MLVLKIAWRSVIRHRRRSIITGSAITFGLVLTLFQLGVASDSHDRMAEMGIRMGSGHVLVQGDGFQAQQTLAYVVPNPQAIVTVARKIPGVKHVALRAHSSGLIRKGDLSSAVLVVGVDPELEPQSSDVPEKMLKVGDLRLTLRLPGNRRFRFALNLLLPIGKRRGPCVRGLLGRGAKVGESGPVALRFGGAELTLALNAKESCYIRPLSALANRNYPADILIGAGLAKTLDVKIGEDLLLTVSPRGGGRAEGAKFIVSGIFRTGVNEVDSGMVYIPLKSAQKLLHLGRAVTQVAVLVDTLEQTAQVQRALSLALANHKGLEILPWQVALKELYDAIVLDDGGMYVFLAIIFVVVVIGIFNTVLMSVLERTKEFGVMMALGTSGGRLFLIVACEAVLLGLVAAGVGLALGYALHSWVATVGIDISTLIGEDLEMAGISFSGRIYSKLPLAVALRWTFSVVVVVLLSALYPAYRATRLEPVEAMRHV